MSRAPYMQLWVADFLGDTLHLSAEEVGQYMLLLMAMWRNGGTLPDDPDALSRIARKAITESVMKFFDRDLANATICQKRLLAELDKARAKSKVRRVAGKRGGHAKALRHKQRNGVANATILPQQNPTILQSQNIDTIVSILSEVVGLQKAHELVLHRKSLKKPLKENTARLLAQRLERCRDAREAADEMMVRGWVSVKPEWLNGNGHGPPGRRSPYADAAFEMMEKIERERDDAEIIAIADHRAKTRD